MMKEVTMSKQTSIEWLYNKMYEHRGNITIEEFEQAKQMHKDEIESAFNNGMVNSVDWFTDATTEEAEAYYQETYGGNNES